MKGRELKDYRRESRLFIRRALAAALLVLLALSAILARLFYLQVMRHDHFTTLAHDNRVKLLPLPPTRGLIYDRSGRLLAYNRPSFNLEIVPEKAGNLKQTIERLSRVIPILDSDRERFERLRRQRRRFDSIPVKLGISSREAALFAVNQHKFPGVSIRARLTRTYPLGAPLAHVVGYVGRISRKDLQRIDPSNYAGTTHVGKTGIERAYESVLHGHVGYQQVEVNAQGKTVRVLKEIPPQPGRTLILNLDSSLQQVALDAFGDHNGAAVAIDPRNGAVLALVSKPGFDPNLFVDGISSRDYRSLRNDPNKPLFNRALKGVYPPGSTVKPFMGLAGLELGVITTSTKLNCRGYFQLPGREHKYRDWKKVGHGITDLDKAITQSCDVFFYRLAHQTGIDRLQSFLANFRFGEHTGIDLVGERRGIRPSREWKRKRYHQIWFPGETVIIGIGQGSFQATPLQLAAATAALANGGHYYEPRLVRELVDEASGKHTPVPTVEHPIPVGDPANWKAIQQAMLHVVEGAHGTARRIRTPRYRIAGKTGTAQVFSVAQDAEYKENEVSKQMRDHALFIAYAPVEAPRIAVAVVVEHGGHGGSAAAPIARKIMDAWLIHQGHLPRLSGEKQ